MRALFGCMAILFGAVSVILCARYGFKLADNDIDGAVGAIFYGTIALCAFVFDGAAVRLWFWGHRGWAVVIGVIATAALVVTFTNSLGAIAMRGDATQATRANAKDNRAADRAELARIATERGAMSFMPATAQTVQAARDAVSAAEAIRIRECGGGDIKQRGPNCRLRETEEQAKRDAVVTASANKDATDRASRLDAEAAAVRARLKDAQPVQSANPLGSALEMILGAGASVLTAWQQAIVAGVYELCLVGIMVIFELLGQQGGPLRAQEEVNASANAPASAPSAPSPPARRPPPPRAVTKPVSKQGKPAAAVGGVESFLAEEVKPAAGGRTDVKVLLSAYRGWCKRGRKEALELADFVRAILRDSDITVEPGNDGRAYALDVALKTEIAEAAATGEQRAAVN